MKVGIDILDTEDFDKQYNNAGSELLDKYLNPEEQQGSVEHLAGLFCAKEAIIKTGFIKLGEWKSILVRKDDIGRPLVFSKEGLLIDQIEISISHSKNTVVAIAILA